MARAELKTRPHGASVKAFHYKYDSGREGDWMLTGVMPHAALMKTLGKDKAGESCLDFKRFEDIDLPTLERIIEASVEAAP